MLQKPHFLDLNHSYYQASYWILFILSLNMSRFSRNWSTDSQLLHHLSNISREKINSISWFDLCRLFEFRVCLLDPLVASSWHRTAPSNEIRNKYDDDESRQCYPHCDRNDVLYLLINFAIVNWNVFIYQLCGWNIFHYLLKYLRGVVLAPPQIKLKFVYREEFNYSELAKICEF